MLRINEPTEAAFRQFWLGGSEDRPLPDAGDWQAAWQRLWDRKVFRELTLEHSGHAVTSEVLPRGEAISFTFVFPVPGSRWEWVSVSLGFDETTVAPQRLKTRW